MNHRQDEFSFILILTAAIGIAGFVFSAVNGSEGIYYTAMPLLAFLLFSSVFGQEADVFIAGQFSQRMRKGKVKDAVIFFESGLVCGAVTGLAVGGVLALFGSLLGALLWGNGHISLSLYTLVPAFPLMGLLGPCMGFLRSAGRRKLLHGLHLAYLAVSVIASAFLGRFMSYRGEKIALLLRNDTYAAIYGGAGMGLAFSLATLADLAAALVFVLPMIRSLNSRETVMDIDHDENMRDIVPYCLRKYTPFLPAALLPFGFFVLDVRIAQAFLTENAEASTRFGAVLGVGESLFFGLAGLVLFRTIGLVRIPLRSLTRRPTRTFQEQYSMLFEIPAFLAAPACLFPPAAARSIMQMAKKGLEQGERQVCVFGLRTGFPLMFFLVFAVLALVFTWRAGYKNAVYSSMGIAGVGQVAVLYVGCFLGSGEHALPIALASFAGLALLLCLVMTRRGFIGRGDTYYLQIWGRALGAALIAALAVGLLDGYVSAEIIPVGGAFLLLLLYLAIYLPLAVLFGALNPADIDWVWFGRTVGRLMRHFGKMEAS